MRTLSLHVLHTPAQRHWSSLSWKHRMDQSQRKGPDGAQDARVGITPMHDLARRSPLFPLTIGCSRTKFPTRARKPAHFILRLPDPVERLARDTVLSEKEAQLSRMFGARGAGCTTGARKSSSASTTSRGKPPGGALARLTTRAACSGTSDAAAPDRHGVPPWCRAVREGHVLVPTHPG